MIDPAGIPEGYVRLYRRRIARRGDGTALSSAEQNALVAVVLARYAAVAERNVNMALVELLDLTGESLRERRRHAVASDAAGLAWSVAAGRWAPVQEAGMHIEWAFELGARPGAVRGIVAACSRAAFLAHAAPILGRRAEAELARWVPHLRTRVAGATPPLVAAWLGELRAAPGGHDVTVHQGDEVASVAERCMLATSREQADELVSAHGDPGRRVLWADAAAGRVELSPWVPLGLGRLAPAAHAVAR